MNFNPPDNLVVIQDILNRNGYMVTKKDEDVFQVISPSGEYSVTIGPGKIHYPTNHETDAKKLRDKFWTEAELAKENIKAVQSIKVPTKDISHNQILSESKQALQSIGLPAIVKPNRGSMSEGFSKIEQEQDLDYYFKNIFDGKTLIFQKFIDNVREYRVLIAYGKVYGVFEKSFVGITGNGVQTVQELLDVFPEDTYKSEARIEQSLKKGKTNKGLGPTYGNIFENCGLANT